MSKRTQTGKVRSAYELIKAHSREYDVRTMCRVLTVAASGYYAWLQDPVSNRAQEDTRLLRLISASFTASHGIYGAPRVFLDLREAGETCSRHRVARLMRVNKIRALHGYRTRRYYLDSYVGGMALPRRRNGPVLQEDRRMGYETDNPPRARPRCGDHGCETAAATWNDYPLRPGLSYSSDDWHRFCRTNRLEPSMSRRGNCWDNAVAESFFGSLKKERIKKRIFKSRELATQEISEYIEAFYNRIRRHRHLGGVSPEVFEASVKRR
jgi:putative transposase